MSKDSLLLSEASFPFLLKQMKGAPQQLFYEGDVQAFSLPSISIVGSRRMSDYGERVVRSLVPALVKAGLAIVSGLAYGVDGYAHRVALQFRGICLGVLGSSLDRMYPSSNKPLFRDIVKHGGCVVSEYPPGTQTQAYHFPARNRIVAGLSPVTLIIEAGDKSGTLITASCALDAGREVCVVPGDITQPQSQGVHRLLKQGAHPVTCVEDILELYGPLAPTRVPEQLHPALTGSLATLYDLILHGQETLEELTRASRLDPAELQSILSVLELDGYIHSKGDRWQRT